MYRFDYLCVEAVGSFIHRRVSALDSLRPARTTACGKVGRHQDVTTDELASAMSCARFVWYLIVVISVVGTLVLIVVVGQIVGHQNLAGPVLLIPGAAGGLFAFAATLYAFTVVRSMYLRDALNNRVPTMSLRFATPKAYDAWVAMAVGVAVMLMTMAA